MLSCQIVVLARVIVDVDQVALTAEGVTQLVKVLRSDDDNAIILAGMTSYILRILLLTHTKMS